MRHGRSGAPLALALLLGGVVQVRSAAAQLPDPGAAALGMSEAYTALARGFNATALNPAGLAMPGGPRASAAVASVRGIGGLGPVDLGDLARYQGETLSMEVRQGWLDRITESGGEEGMAAGELTYLAAQYGRFGVQFASTADMVSNLGPGAAELVLFGNAGRTGEPVDVDLRGSAFDLAVTSTFGVGYGHPLIREEDRALSVGATLKYTVGHLMATALDLGGEATADPLAMRVQFPIVQSDSTLGFGGSDTGSGLGLDLGIAWSGGPVQVAVDVRNLVNSFDWNESNLVYRAGAVTVEGETRATDFEPQPFAAAPEEVRRHVRELGFPTVLAAGVAYLPREDLRFTLDLRERIGEGRASQPNQVGIGAEYRPLAWLPLRAGASALADGYQLAAGLGLRLGPVRLDAAAARRKTDLGTGRVGMVSLSIVQAGEW